MRSIARCCFTLCLIVGTVAPLWAEIPVAILPFTGGKSAADVEAKVRQYLPSRGNIAVVSEDMLKKIIQLHEQAQTLGGACLDISKLKAAEYLIKGEQQGDLVRISVVSVNTGTELLNRTIKAVAFDQKKTIKDMREAIVMASASAGDIEVPADAAPYMKLVEGFVKKLSGEIAGTYPYLAFYAGGAYQHPIAGDARMEENARRFVGVVRPLLLNTTPVYNGFRTETGIVRLFFITKKNGIKSRHTFRFMELTDGTMGIIEYKPE